MSSMPARRILQLGDPLLRAVSRPVSHPSEARAILGDLAGTLHEFQRAHGFGRAISAVQIGEPKRLIYMEFEGAAYGLINPRCERLGNASFTLWDDCFSFPGLLVRVKRAESIDVSYLDELGRERALHASGALSELLQHELDHLDGILAIDRALDRDSLCTREEWSRRYGPRATGPGSGAS